MLRIKHAAAPGSKGMLQPILTRYRADFIPASIFALPAVQAVINFKWETWARSWTFTSLLLFLMWLVSYSAFSVLVTMEDTAAPLPLSEVLTSFRGCAAFGLSAASMLFMMFFFWMDVCTMRAYGWLWFTTYNVLDFASYVIQVSPISPVAQCL